MAIDAISEADDLPEQEGGVRLGDYAGKLCVFDDAKEANDNSQYGQRDTIHAALYVFDPDDEQANGDGWVAVGEVIVWFKTVGKQIMDKLPNQAAGILTKGNDRNVNEWVLAPVPKSAKKMLTALTTWTNSF